MKNNTLDRNSAEFLFEELSEIIADQSSSLQDKLLHCRLIFKDLLNKLTEHESQFFSGLYPKTIFIADKYALPYKIKRDMRKFRWLVAQVKKDQSRKCSEIELSFSIFTLSKLIELFSSVPIPESFSPLLYDYEITEAEYSNYDRDATFIRKIQAVVIPKFIDIDNIDIDNKDAVDDENLIYCETDELGAIKLVLNGKWAHLRKMVQAGDRLNIINVNSKIIDKINQLSCKPSTIIVLQPDFLIDVTDIAECFLSEGVNTNLHFLKKFVKSSTSAPMATGNIINTCFDELLYDPEIDFETAFNKAMSYKPLQMFALAYRDPGSIALIKAKAEKQFNILKGLVPDFPNDLLSVEPSFVSADYGLQGRLDLMTESATDKGRKNIIELKSGKAPSRDMYFKSADGKTVSIGLWSNHLAQTTGYNLLVDSTFDRGSGYSQILYSSDDRNPLRNAPNIQGKKQELMIQRNHIIAGERQLAEGDSSLLSNICPEEFGIRPPYTEKDLEFFADKMNDLDEIETAYFREYLSFLQREIFTAKIGNGRNGFGYSALWNDSLTEKIKAYRVISDLTLNRDESDFKKYHLVFNRPESGENVSVFRKGDIVLLYPLNDNGSADPLSRQLLKGFIKEISSDRIKVSLRNKLFNDTFFDSDNKWALEPDYIESSSKSLVRSLFDFVKSDKQKKDIILGRKLPKSKNVEPKYADELNDSQKTILTKALSAQDYFLLQGPPGTGKTSYMLRYIVRNIFETSEENILILAYTNRAVDEICSSLKKIAPDFPFLRTGSKDSSVHSENLISQLSDDGTLRELYIRFRSTRIFVSTVSSVLSNPEILEMISFDTAIIDEASQILEPQIVGILASVGRFIMIGDEKQLPAITTNRKNTESINHEELNKIGLTNLSDSLFERLLRINIAAENDSAYDMLTQQARMHEDIQDFPNKFFYESKLQTFPKFDWQRSAEQVFSFESDDPIERTVAESRMIFIESKFEKNSKVNFEEARICSLLTRMIKRVYGDDFDENTVGIISPFRAQCAEIYNQTDDNIRDLLSVDTVERFQGSERDIIIISFAANYRSQVRALQSLTYIKDKLIDRKLNVALTRARRHVIILGNPEILETSPVFVDLIAYIKAYGQYIGEELSESLI